MFNVHYSITEADDKVTLSRAEVYSHGLVQWWRIGQFSSVCSINVEWFPFDEQKCVMTFISLDDDNQVHLETSNYSASYKDDGEWKFAGKLSTPQLYLCNIKV